MKAVDNENLRYEESDFSFRRVDDDIVFDYLDAIKRTHNQTEILDIGCGSGVFAEEMLEKGFKVKGIDFAKNAVERARQRGIDAVIGDLDEGINEENSSYDIIVATDILEHVYDPMFVLQEAERVLRPGGHIIVNVPNLVTPMVRLWTLFGYSYQEPVYRRRHIYKHHTFFTLSLIRHMLEFAKFNVTTHQRVANITKKKQVKGRGIPLLLTHSLTILARKEKK